MDRHLPSYFVTALDTKERNEERQSYETRTHPQRCAVRPHLGPVVLVLLVVTADRSRHDSAEGQTDRGADLERGVDESAGG